jgi:tRNA pseudouridine32 synthase/23S rRNA pseudouridine746 synthase
MAISKYPSIVTLPKGAKPYPAILDFLAARFPNIQRNVWHNRIKAGKVLHENGQPISIATAYVPFKRLYYFREVEAEAVIPFSEEILFQNEEILVACKPHFLPVTPAGPYVNECLLNRLRKRTGNNELAPLHRLDRETAGIVLFSANQKSRARYHELFRNGLIEKTYQAVCELSLIPKQTEWLLANRIVRRHPWFRMKIVAGEVNARSKITFMGKTGNKGFFRLQPLTGKKHQLRLHLSGLGFRIVNDRYYPDLLPARVQDYRKPLQLIAETITFCDPFTRQIMAFSSGRTLSSAWRMPTRHSPCYKELPR